MNFNEYEAKAKETAIYPKEAKILYPTLGLGGEAGEVLEKIKKIYRKDPTFQTITNEQREEIKKELGDVLWYVTIIGADLGIHLEDIAQLNVQKLASRKDRGVLHSEGDNR